MQPTPTPASVSRFLDFLYGGGLLAFGTLIGWCVKTFRGRKVERASNTLAEARADVDVIDLVEKVRAKYLESINREAEANRQTQIAEAKTDECEELKRTVERQLSMAQQLDGERCTEIARLQLKVDGYEKQFTGLQGGE